MSGFKPLQKICVIKYIFKESPVDSTNTLKMFLWTTVNNQIFDFSVTVGSNLWAHALYKNKGQVFHGTVHQGTDHANMKICFDNIRAECSEMLYLVHPKYHLMTSLRDSGIPLTGLLYDISVKFV